MTRLVWIAVCAALAGAISTSAAAAAAPRSISVPILMYHRIDVLRPSLPPMTRRLTVSPGDFRRQMTWLARNGYHSITQQQLLAATEGHATLPPKPVMITFDDGYADVYTNASPVLARLHMHATAYVITSRISGRDTSFLTWPELRALERRGIQVGSHTETHAALTALTTSAMREELVGARTALQRALHHPVPWLAYPYGAVDGHVVAVVRASGYALAVTTRSGACQSPAQPLQLHRLEVLDTTGVAGLRALVASHC